LALASTVGSLPFSVRVFALGTAESLLLIGRSTASARIETRPLLLMPALYSPARPGFGCPAMITTCRNLPRVSRFSNLSLAQAVEAPIQSARKAAALGLSGLLQRSARVTIKRVRSGSCFSALPLNLSLTLNIGA